MHHADKMAITLQEFTESFIDFAKAMQNNGEKNGETFEIELNIEPLTYRQL